jgi:hypothetical protein
VIVVIVREEDGVERRQLGDRRRHGMKAARTGERQRRGALAEHRIGQDAHAVGLEQHRRVAEPRDAQAGRRRHLLPRRQRALDRQLDGRATIAAPEEEFAHDRQRIALQPRARAARVVEDAVAELLGRVRALAP